MQKLRLLKAALIGGTSAFVLANPAFAKVFDIPQGDLETALDTYTTQAGVQLIYSDKAVRGHKSNGARGQLTEIAALTEVLKGSGFTTEMMPSNIISIVPEERALAGVRMAQVTRGAAQVAPPPPQQTGLETVVVTAQKKSEDIQTVPIAVTALSQEQLTDRQIAAGPDLIRDVPNMNFGKTNFSGYSIELRGIGTQAISVTTDPAVAVAFNGTPFIRNHFFEQEFFDVDNIEVLRGPQGTLYGRNATAGVVNLIPAKPTDQFEAMVSADIGNYENRRLEGMINLPIAGDQLDIRAAGEWTKREGYTFDSTTDQHVDGRDLWSGRVTIGFKPTSDVQTYLVWEHFSEDDDRLRSGKQLCKTAPIPSSVGGQPVPPIGSDGEDSYVFDPATYFSQGCEMTSLYSSDAFEVPNGYSAQYIKAAKFSGTINPLIDPYASTTQSSNLREIESVLQPHYKAKNDTLEFNVDWTVNPALTLTSQTGYNNDFLFSTEDYNRFNTSPGLFIPGSGGHNGTVVDANGYFCDPQLGCSNRLVGEDLSDETAWQFSQEFRLASNFSGPFNFNVGGNYLHYETEENYYVFLNTLTMFTLGSFGGNPDVSSQPYVPGVTTNTGCFYAYGYGYQVLNPKTYVSLPSQDQCNYIDPNPIGHLNNLGHNYFLSQNPYMLNSYAVFGEAYYNIMDNLKLTTGLRFTDDQKTFFDLPSELLTGGEGYYETGTVKQGWDRFTGRAVLNWTPQLDFTDQTLIYASYAHGYKAGGANPPGAALIGNADGNISFPDHPLTFKPEYIEAFELGTKNTLLDGALTLNGDIFYYNYTGYQISEIVDRTAINNNYNAHVEGAELESNWEPMPGLKFNFAGGWEDTGAAGGDSGIDLMDRTAGNPNWIVVKPYPTQASNCILPTYVVGALLQEYNTGPNPGQAGVFLAEACGTAYNDHLDPLTDLPYKPTPLTSCTTCAINGQQNQNPPLGYIGFDPASAPNNGEGFSKNLKGHELPNAPPFTLSTGAQYSFPVMQDWAATLRADFYWQADSWARIFNDNPYDRLRGYTNLNLALILASDDGWQVMGYVKNVFDTTAITGDFLNSDDSQLTTNIFLTDPRLYGIRVTKQFGEGDTGAMADVENWIAGVFSDPDKGTPTLWITVGGSPVEQSGQGDPFVPPFVTNFSGSSAYKPDSVLKAEEPSQFSYDQEAKITFQPEGSEWNFAAEIQYSRAVRTRYKNEEAPNQRIPADGINYSNGVFHVVPGYETATRVDFSTVASRQRQTHAVVDFEAGKDVGVGLFGDDNQATVDVGVRIAQFMSKSSSTIHARPDEQHYNGVTSYIKNYLHSANLYFPYSKFHTYGAQSRAKRTFHGVGPKISWNDSVPVMGNPGMSELSFDWGMNGAVLFGRRKAIGEHQVSGHYHQDKYGNSHYYTHAGNFKRTREVVVPNLGGFAGVSFKYANAKVSFGYRGDFFFNAMDEGWDKPKVGTLGFFGPYANLSIGFGG